MASRVSSSDDEHFSVSRTFVGDSCVPVEIFAGDPVYASGRLKRRRPFLKVIVLALVCAGVWGWQQLPETVRTEVRAQVASLSGQLVTKFNEWRAAPPPAAETVSAPPPAPPPLADTREVVTAPAAVAGEAMPSPPPKADAANPESRAADATAPPADAANGAEGDTPQPLPEPVADPNDPLQKRALAAGLHPGVSRAVLARLSKADFSNAARAIKTALAETPPSGVYAWPKDGGGKTALFEVKFVKGADASCRRYVVIVTKTHWSTTAPPMERCGGKKKWDEVKQNG